MPTRTPTDSPSEPFSLIHKVTQRALYSAVRKALQHRRDEKYNDVAEIAAAMALRPNDVVLVPRSSAALGIHSTAEALDTKSSRQLRDSIASSVQRLCTASVDAVALLAGVEVESSPEWLSTISFAGRCRLPLLLLAHTRPGPNRPDLRTLYAEYGDPATTVDAHDAIAVFRVMTEAAHNARVGRGTSLIEAAYFDGTPGVASPDPLACLEAYMRRHGAWFRPEELQ